ncbi:MAG: hypothetical protein JWN29_1274 [Acidimicrobiales bacterium]|nr:hypothetical protein [Acidimicrobiales bacterium]
MLDDRLTTAGVALREAPVPETSSAALDRRRRARQRRRVATVAAIALVAGSVGLIELTRPDAKSVHVVDEDGAPEVQVPAPKAAGQLLPARLPDGWHLTGWSERGGSSPAGNPTIWVYGQASEEYTLHPYAAVLDIPSSTIPTVQPTDETVLVHGTPAKIASTGDLRHINFRLGTRNLTVLGSLLDDETLRQFAEGVAADAGAPGGLGASWLPDGFTPILLAVSGYGETVAGRSFDWAGPGGSLHLSTATNDVDRIEQLLWQEPGTEILRRKGVTYGRRRQGAEITLRWVIGDGVTAYASSEGISDDAFLDIVSQLEERTPAEVADEIDRVPSNDNAMFQRTVSLAVPIFDDWVGGRHYLADVFLALDRDGKEMLCERAGSGTSCGLPRDGTPKDGAALEPLQASGDFGILLLRDDVATLAVRYRGQATRVYPVVRPFAGYGGVAGVAQPEGATVEVIEARAADGSVLGRLRGPVTLG